MPDDPYATADGPTGPTNAPVKAGITDGTARGDKPATPTEGGPAAEESEAHPS